jgi:hypothetical protein
MDVTPFAGLDTMQNGDSTDNAAGRAYSFPVDIHFFPLKLPVGDRRIQGISAPGCGGA